VKDGDETGGDQNKNSEDDWDTDWTKHRGHVKYQSRPNRY